MFWSMRIADFFDAEQWKRIVASIPPDEQGDVPCRFPGRAVFMREDDNLLFRPPSFLIASKVDGEWTPGLYTTVGWVALDLSPTPIADDATLAKARATAQKLGFLSTPPATDEPAATGTARAALGETTRDE